MKLNKLFLLLALVALATVVGMSQFQPLTSDMVACCDPATDPDCDGDGDGDGDGDDGSDSMPMQIIG